MILIGIIDDNDSFDEFTTIYKILKPYKVKFILSYKNILRDSRFSSIDEYFSSLKNSEINYVFIKLHSSDLIVRNNSIKFNILLINNLKHYVDFYSPDYLVYNYDAYHRQDFIKDYKVIKYSYGISYNADIFPSSIQDDSLFYILMICINKNIVTISNNPIVAQEFSLKVNNLCESKIYNILAAVIILIILDININTLMKNFEIILKEEKAHA